MNIKRLFKFVIAGIRADGFDWKDFVIPFVIEGAAELAQRVVDGKTANATWVAVIQMGYYATYRFEKVLIDNPDETYRDEMLIGVRKVCVDAAAEGSFLLDIPDDLEN